MGLIHDLKNVFFNKKTCVEPYWMTLQTNEYIVLYKGKPAARCVFYSSIKFECSDITVQWAENNKTLDTLILSSCKGRDTDVCLECKNRFICYTTADMNQYAFTEYPSVLLDAVKDGCPLNVEAGDTVTLALTYEFVLPAEQKITEKACGSLTFTAGNSTQIMKIELTPLLSKMLLPSSQLEN